MAARLAALLVIPASVTALWALSLALRDSSIVDIFWGAGFVLVVWWGHYLIAVASGAWWTIYSPVLMTFLLVRVSGVAMLESALRDSKPGDREYIESTSAFFPLPPRRR
jgi:steroid 5-alpha reductase family enzyme